MFILIRILRKRYFDQNENKFLRNIHTSTIEFIFLSVYQHIAKLNSYSTDKRHVPVVKHLKMKRNVNCHSQDHPRRRPYSIRFLSITCDAKGAQNIWHTMGKGAQAQTVARHSLTNTRKVSGNESPATSIRATGLLHVRVQLNRPRGSTRFSGIIVKRNERTSILFCNVSLVFYTR